MGTQKKTRTTDSKVGNWDLRENGTFEMVESGGIKEIKNIFVI